ncbi:hypothetical protein QYE76_043314 [Lolium multiflorum]|uniref:Uncharacterized protein n=1 Tax=Lolium multiflorum TaxID=4521 RepID=A0AAD8TIW6_LOLMU|nr:hypothetical protein QYE76_043314 [Lolium multiflorum]
MAPKREFSPSANDHEAGSSRPVTPAPFAMGPPATPRRGRIYVTIAIGFRCRPSRAPAAPATPRSGGAALSAADLQQDPAYGDASPNWDLWFEVEHDARRRTCFTSATARPRAQPRTPARRAGRRPGGLYINEPAPQPQPQPQPQEEEDDPELQAALAASREQGDLDELAKWPHLAETLRTSALEEAARKAQEDAQAEAWAFLELAHRQEEATAEEQLRGESARRARLRRPASPPNPDSAGKGRSGRPAGVPGALRRSSRNSASPPGGVVVIDADDDEYYWG